MGSAQVVQAQAPMVDVAGFAPPEISLWTLFWDPTFVALLIVFLALVGISYLHPSGRRFVKKQTDYLDHQRDVNERSLEQNKAMETIVARQYAETNARAEKALQQGEAALRLHAEALEQLKGLNDAVTRLSALMEQERGGRPA